MLDLKIKSVSLKWKFAAVVFLALLVVLVILLSTLRGFLNREFDALYGDPGTKGIFVADLLGQDLKPIITENIDSQNLQQTVDAYKAQYGVYGLRYIFLLDASNEVIVDTYKTKVPDSLVQLNLLPEDASEMRKAFDAKGKTYHDCAAALKLADGSRGTIRIGIEEQHADSPVWQRLKQSHVGGIYQPILIIALLLAVLVTVLLTLAFWWLVIRRIESISQATERMSFGDLDSEVETQSQDEFGSLEETLNQMRANLKDAIERLKRRK
jgi:methyl-accepting chemotaxis protein